MPSGSVSGCIFLVVYTSKSVGQYNIKNNQVWARLMTIGWHVMIVVGTLNVGCISLTIQRKSDLKALSSEKIMINKCIDYSHVIR